MQANCLKCLSLIKSYILNKLKTGYKNNSLYKSKVKSVFRCSNCGHIEYEKEGWKKCPLCELEQGYIAIDYADVFEKAVCKN